MPKRVSKIHPPNNITDWTVFVTATAFNPPKMVSSAVSRDVNGTPHI